MMVTTVMDSIDEETKTEIMLMRFVTISSTGNAQDFGDLAQGGTYSRGCSSGNGGL